MDISELHEGMWCRTRYQSGKVIRIDERHGMVTLQHSEKEDPFTVLAARIQEGIPAEEEPD